MTKVFTVGKTSKYIIFAICAIALVASLSFYAFSTKAATTDYVFLVRGIVKGGGDSTNISVYITHASGKAQTDLAGVVQDFNVSSATLYKWGKNSKGTLVKNKVTANPVPGKEVVMRGAKKSNGTFVASWVVENYRIFTLNGTLEGVTIDTGFTDEGWVTVNVTDSTIKEAAIKSKDILIRINGLTKIRSLGNAKILDELTAGQQKVRVSGAITDESTWVASKMWEL